MKKFTVFAQEGEFVEVDEGAGDTEFAAGRDMRAGSSSPKRKFRLVNRTTGAVRGSHDNAKDAAAHHNALTPDQKAAHKVVVANEESSSDKNAADRFIAKDKEDYDKAEPAGSKERAARAERIKAGLRRSPELQAFIKGHNKIHQMALDIIKHNKEHEAKKWEKAGFEPTPKNEEVEPIDELKKSTLASYAGKAAKSLRANTSLGKDFEHDANRSLGRAMKKGGDYSKSAEYKDHEVEAGLEHEFKHKADKRVKGIAVAAKKLAKEDYQSLENNIRNIMAGNVVESEYKDLVGAIRAMSKRKQVERAEIQNKIIDNP